MLDMKTIEAAVKAALVDFEQNKDSVTIGVSQRHVHLSRKDLDILFGEGFELTKKKKKAANAVARKLNTALYYMMITRQKFSYENYAIAKASATFNIPVEELLLVNPGFKRYIKYL